MNRVLVSLGVLYPMKRSAFLESASETLGQGIPDATQIKVAIPREYLKDDETPAHMSTRLLDVLMCQVLKAGDTFMLRARVHQEDQEPIKCLVKYVYPYEDGPAQVVPTTFWSWIAFSQSLFQQSNLLYQE